MSFYKRQIALVVGTGIIVLANAVALGGVAYNRSGTADSRLQLSERELGYNPYQREDNSGVALNVLWKVLSKNPLDLPGKGHSYEWHDYSREAYWLDNAKMRELGFDVETPIYQEAGAYHYKELKDREVFLVLEFNGPAYATYTAQVKEYAKKLDSKEEATREILEAEHEVSRLFVVDAGTDADVLRKRYPNRVMYVVAKGVVGAHWQGTDDKPVMNAYVKSLSVSSLHVSKPHDAVFSGYKGDGDAKLNYRVDVDYGKRYEPWITSARKTNP